MSMNAGATLNNFQEFDINTDDWATGTLIGSVAGLPATSPGGPFASSDLRGNEYVWFTVWQNNFAGNVVAIDNVRTGLYPAPFVVKTYDQNTLSSLLPTADANDTRRLNDALKHLTKSLSAEYWTSEGRLSSKGGAVFQQQKDAVIKLLELVNSGFNVAVLQGVIADLVSAARSLAQIAIDQATDAKKIAKAQDELSKAAADSAAGRPSNAIEHYRNAWNHAMQ